MATSCTPQAAGEPHLRFARSIIAGTLLSLLISVGFAYCRLALSTAGMSSDYITAGAVAVFFLLTAFLNPLLKLVHLPWGFNRGELAVVYAMLIIASTIPTWGFSANLIPMLPAVYYFATAENDWAELIHPHIHRWMVVQDRDAVTYFFEGLPEGAAIPWSAWVVPLVAWLTFIVAIYLMMIALMVLLRRQWVDHERLLFPLVQLPLQMIEEGRPGDRFGPFLKSPLMWVGFLVPFCLMSTHGLNFYFPVIPKVDLYTVIVPFRDFGALEILLSFTVLGLAYFLSFALASSLWVFHLLANLQMGVQYIIGYRLSGEIEKFMEGTLMLAHQGMGAMLALIAYGIWTARDHLKAVALKVWRSGPNAIDDSGEMLSYRAAALLLGVCSLYVTAWLALSGVPLWVTIVFLLVAFGVFLFMARLIAESGLGFIRPQMTSQTIVINFLGTGSVTPPGIFSLAMTFSWAGNLRILLMASAINGMKLAEGVGALRRPLFWAMVVAMLVSLLSSVWLVIYLAYEHGGINLELWAYQAMAQAPSNFTAYKILNPVSLLEPFDVMGPRLLFTGIGGAVMTALIWARHHFLWWPIHYIGFAVSATNMTSASWFSIFLGSVLKAFILKYGGVRLYRALRPLFLGFILGQITCSAFWLVVDLLAGGTGNKVPVFSHHY